MDAVPAEQPPGQSTEQPTELRADCARCVGLCCVTLPFAASADFAIDKPAGVPCPHLGGAFGCGIHDRLRDEGFRGCAVYECFGAGQRVAQRTFAGGDDADWRDHPERTRAMTAAFPVVRQLHELLVYLDDALSRTQTAPMRPALRAAFRRTDELAGGAPDALARLDVAAHRADVAALLRRASRLVRTPAGPDHAGADLVAASRRGARLSRADLRGALLIGADLRHADLREADLIGADLRDTDLRGADLRDALYLVQPQLDAARGDAGTTLDDRFRRPAHWPR